MKSKPHGISSALIWFESHVLIRASTLNAFNLVVFIVGFVIGLASLVIVTGKVVCTLYFSYNHTANSYK